MDEALLEWRDEQTDMTPQPAPPFFAARARRRTSQRLRGAATAASTDDNAANSNAPTLAFFASQHPTLGLADVSEDLSEI